MKRPLGSHALVTGGSSGLGEALALALAQRGLRITLVARDPARLEAAAGRIRAASPGARVGVCSVDLRSYDAVVAAFAALDEPIDLLVNNAGVLREGHFGELPLADFAEVMDIDYFGPLHATRAALPDLLATRGRLVNVASVAGLLGVFGYSAYCPAKHALVGLTQTLRFELEPRGIEVHLVCPPEFDSPMIEVLDQSRTPENAAHTLTIPKVPVDLVVREVLAGLERGRFLIVPGRRTRSAVSAARLLPGLAHLLGARRIASVRP